MGATRGAEDDPLCKELGINRTFIGRSLLAFKEKAEGLGDIRVTKRRY